jgi:hypothetical protein
MRHRNPRYRGPGRYSPPPPHYKTPTMRKTRATHTYHDAPITPSTCTEEHQPVPYDNAQWHPAGYTWHVFCCPRTKVGHSFQTQIHPCKPRVPDPQMRKHKPQLQQHNTSIPTMVETEYAEMQNIEHGKTTRTSPLEPTPAHSPTSCPRHKDTPACRNSAKHRAQPHLAYHSTIDSHAYHNHLPTHRTKHTTWTIRLATNTKEHKHHTYQQTPHNPTLKQPPCPQTHKAYTIPNTLQTTPNQLSGGITLLV